MLLILAVVALSVIATHGRYVPESDPVHFLPTATKMNVAPLVAFAPPVMFEFAKVVPPQARFWALPRRQSEQLELRQIGLTVSLQHRSPPSLLA
jgi:hypothetical protein